MIDRTGVGVSDSRALDDVAGAAPFNDVTARDPQHANHLWTTGKAIDTFVPFGPALVLRDEVPDFQSLSVLTPINGEIVQDGSTASMIFSVAEAASNPPRWLQTADIVEVAIGGLGEIANPVGSPRPGPDA